MLREQNIQSRRQQAPTRRSRTIGAAALVVLVIAASQSGSLLLWVAALSRYQAIAPLFRDLPRHAANPSDAAWRSIVETILSTIATVAIAAFILWRAANPVILEGTLIAIFCVVHQAVNLECLRVLQSLRSNDSRVKRERRAARLSVSYGIALMVGGLCVGITHKSWPDTAIAAVVFALLTVLPRDSKVA